MTKLQELTARVEKLEIIAQQEAIRYCQVDKLQQQSVRKVKILVDLYKGKIGKILKKDVKNELLKIKLPDGTTQWFEYDEVAVI